MIFLKIHLRICFFFLNEWNQSEYIKIEIMYMQMITPEIAQACVAVVFSVSVKLI